MRVRFLSGQSGPSPELRRRMERRLRLVVGHRAPSVSALDITLSLLETVPGHETAPAAARCRLRARLHSGAHVVIEEQAEDLDRAVELAAWRLDRRLDRRGTRK